MEPAPLADAARMRAAWLVPAASLASAAAALGLARFGYSMLLPAMHADLGWTYAQAGGLNTANAVGYLAGVLVSAAMIRRVGPAASLRWSAGLTAAALLACALTSLYLLLVVLRVIAGASAGLLFVAGGVLAAQLAHGSRQPGAVLGIYYAGVGPGILLSTLLAPLVMQEPGRWPIGWLVLGLLCALCAVLAGRTAGRIDAPPPHPQAGAVRATSLRWTMLAFALFGLGYIPFMTFAVAYWQEAGAGTVVVSLLWATLAITATASAWLSHELLDRPDRALVLLLALVTLSAGLPLISAAWWSLTASSALFGAGFLAVTAAVTDLVRRRRPPEEWPRVLAAMTMAFATGQTIGPVAAGWASDVVGLRGGIGGAVGILALATVAAAMQRRAGGPDA